MLSPNFGRVRPRTRALFLTALLLGLVAGLSPAKAGEKKADPLEGGLAVLEEALDKIQDQALKPPPPGYLVQEALRAYLKRFDPYADYLTPAEYRAYLKAKDPDYAGVGMDLAADGKGDLICYPFPGSPAQRAGVRPGEELLAVDGQPVGGRSVFVVGTAVRGRAGSRVVLELAGPRGQRRRVTLTREPFNYKSVVLERTDSGPVMKILRFTRQTPQELREILGRVGPSRPKVIDLRDNRGGDLDAAGEAAGLFLPRGKKLFALKTNKTTKAYLNRERKGDAGSRLILWQNQETASAAEVFIAALTQNSRATSLGRKSFGKGVAQRVVRMSDGSALFITYGLILPPGGRPFHPAGLKPDQPLADDSTPTLSAATARLLQTRP